MGERIKLHPQLTDEQQDDVIKSSENLGVDIIDYEAFYRVYKVSSVNEDFSEPRCVARGYVMITGNKDYACLFISSLREWYRTSPISSCVKNKDKTITVYTKNSVYELVED